MSVENHPIPAHIRKEINLRIVEIEAEEKVKLFYVCESGSRAWGFPSTNSDYDVRFVYVHHPDWYLTIDLENKRDVIERPINDELDISGWDLRKALKLFRKSNPPLLEWLKSPIIYRDTPAVVDKWRSLVPEFYSPIASFYHYLHMAQGNYRNYLKGDRVRTKKYFYVMRPLFAMQWIERRQDPVPMEFDILIDNMVTNPDLKQVIAELLAKKKAGEEMDEGPRIDILSDYIDTELQRLESIARQQKPSAPSIEKLNDFFRWSLAELWQ